MSPAFRLTVTARRRLKAIADYTEKTWGREQRNTYLAELDAGFHYLAGRPDRGRARPELADGVFSYHLKRHTIFYQIKAGHIAIVDILHDRMDPARHL